MSKWQLPRASPLLATLALLVSLLFTPAMPAASASSGRQIFSTRPLHTAFPVPGTFEGISNKANFSSVLQGNGDSVATAVAADSSGATFVVGYTKASDFPTTEGAYDRSANGDYDAFVVKLDSSGTIQYATLLGGDGLDHAQAVAIGGGGEVYVAGYTESANFPTTAGAFERTRGGINDAFVVKFNTIGSALVFSTLLGGSESDLARALAVDPSGAAYVGGNTTSSDFPTSVGAFDRSYNYGDADYSSTPLGDAFIVKLGPAGASLVYGTYLGGYFRDGAYGLALGPSNAVYVCGLTASEDFPTTAGAYQPELSPSAPKVKYSDAFLAKLALNGAGGADLLYSTFLGGSHADDVATAVTIDASGVAYLTGSTESSQFPTTVGAYNSSFGGGYSNAFIAKLDPAGSGSADLLYSTFLGGDRGDHGLGIGLDAGGNILVAGSTTSDDFPVIDPGSATLTTGETLSFVVRLTPAGSEAFDLLYSTLLRIRDSSPLDESANALAIGPEGEVRLAGFSVIEFGRSAAYVKTVVIPPSYPVNVSVNPAAGGDVRPLARNYMGSVTFTAKATAGYSFTNWTVNGAAGVANNPLSLVITQPTTLVADFTLEFTHAVFLPVILDNAYGGWTTGLSIRNPSDSPTTIKIAYYDGGGNVVTTDSRNLVANGSVGVYQGGRFGGNWAGSAAILSNVPIVATVNEVGPDHSAMSYSGEVTPTTTVYLPVVMDNAYEGWSTGVAIRNASAKLASVSIIYYSANGAFSRWDSAILEGNGYLGLYQGGKFGGNWTGTAIITSDQPIAAVVNEMDKKGRAISYNGLFNESYDFYLPVVLNNAYGGWTTGIGVQSAIHDSYQSPTGVEVWYFDADGAQAGSQWVEVPRGGYSGLYQGGVGLAVGFSGSAFLHIGQPAIAAVVNEVPTTGDAMGYSAIVQPAQVVEIPLVMDNAYGGWSSGIGIENASQSSADVTVTYYDQDGGVIGSPSRTIAGRGYWGLYQGGALGGRAGSARIISTQPIAVVVNAIGPSGAAMSYNGSP